MAHDDRRPQHGHRHARLAEQALDLAPAAQVRRQVLAVGAEPAQVDDLAAAGLRGGLPEGARGRGVALLEVVGVQRVHQVDGDVDPVQGRASVSGSWTSAPTGSPGPAYSSGRRVIARTV